MLSCKAVAPTCETNDYLRTCRQGHPLLQCTFVEWKFGEHCWCCCLWILGWLWILRVLQPVFASFHALHRPFRPQQRPDLECFVMPSWPACSMDSRILRIQPPHLTQLDWQFPAPHHSIQLCRQRYHKKCPHRPWICAFERTLRIGLPLLSWWIDWSADCDFYANVKFGSPIKPHTYIL